ncbi:hypothetical protein [Paenibacillus hexagrammi]|uniref:Uncharacterized protein n=1 Tax=Paenibacillus hexagrammi TaxID=2908839 RepID=A0ABY3SJK6_9BACL|nr:hypothetical protein [Paenibacillus sp. YPD9-1]UJF34208.1 hypothetical protein L0M14_02955 [Paenibacillus sp. YPD9-1]
MKRKILAIMLVFLLAANTSMVYAKGSKPSTSSRSGSFSTGSKSTSNFSGGSSSKTSPSTSTNSSSSSSTSSGFSGGASSKSTVPSMSNSTSSSGSTSSSTGYQRPSSNVTGGSTTNPYTGKTYYKNSTYITSIPSGKRVSSFWPVVGAFAAGSFLGSMLHPWGGYYPAYGGGYVHQSFSFFSLLLDVILILVVVGILMRIFGNRRRRSY